MMFIEVKEKRVYKNTITKIETYVTLYSNLNISVMTVMEFHSVVYWYVM